MKDFGAYIGNQVLADAVTIADPENPNEVEILDIDDLKLGVVINPA